MRKGKFFYNTLSPEEVNRFNEKFKSRKGGCKIDEYLNRSFCSMRDFILCAFIWNNTQEGILYWSEISEREI